MSLKRSDTFDPSSSINFKVSPSSTLMTFPTTDHAFSVAWDGTQFTATATSTALNVLTAIFTSSQSGYTQNNQCCEPSQKGSAAS
jgi:hypothetical protein